MMENDKLAEEQDKYLDKSEKKSHDSLYDMAADNIKE